MARIPCRKFNLGDGMILIAAAAVAFAIIRAIPNPVARWPFRYTLNYLSPSCECLTLACLAVRLRRPRPDRRRLWRQPGAIACVSAAVAVAIFYLAAAVSALIDRRVGILDYSESSSALAGSAIIGSWLTLGLSGTWRAEPGWIDRLGRGLGIVWVVLMLFLFAWLYN